MKLRPLYGHEASMRRLGDAVTSGRFPQAALLTGPPGSGKQRLALWVAQGLLCDAGPGVPCGKCPACGQVLQLAHPDLHWFVPIARPKAGDAKKQLDEVRGLLGETLAERRSNPLYRRPEGMTSHPLASIRLLQQVAAVTPFAGRWKVVVLGNAERLVVQEASQEAANALLKVLEEPPPDTVVMLTTAEPQSLLPTIRSRLVPIRIGRVSDRAVRDFLQAEGPEPRPKGKDLERRVVAAEGCIGRAIGAGEDDDDAAKAAERFLAAVTRGSGPWGAAAVGQTPWSARGDFSAMLDALALSLRDGFRQRVERGEEATGWLRALERVQEVREEAQGNVNPQLGLAVLASDLERML